MNLNAFAFIFCYGIFKKFNSAYVFLLLMRFHITSLNWGIITCCDYCCKCEHALNVEVSLHGPNNYWRMSTVRPKDHSDTHDDTLVRRWLSTSRFIDRVPGRSYNIHYASNIIGGAPIADESACGLTTFWGRPPNGLRSARDGIQRTPIENGSNVKHTVSTKQPESRHRKRSVVLQEKWNKEKSDS